MPIITIIQISNFLPATINTWALDKDFCFSYIFIFWRTCNNAKLMSFHKNISKSSKILGDICDGVVGPMVHMNWISLTICYAVIINFEWFHGRFSWSVSVPFPRTLLDNIKKNKENDPLAFSSAIQVLLSALLQSLKLTVSEEMMFRQLIFFAFVEAELSGVLRPLLKNLAESSSSRVGRLKFILFIIFLKKINTLNYHKSIT